ncbi:MAG: HEAT repeat domain-containing protein [Methanomicrobiales archaeon]|nr:HEAT repeat domain-containing protein [Methanomicrobiales archaeon]
MDYPPETESQPTAERLGALLAGLRSPHKEARAEAARLLGQAGDRALPGLFQAVHDPNWVVRFRTVEALTAISDPRVDPVLIAALQDRRDHVRYLAAKGLGIRKVPAAFIPLLSCLGDENEFVRMSAARSLAILGDPQAVPALQERLQKEVGRVAEEIKKAIYCLEYP